MLGVRPMALQYYGHHDSNHNNNNHDAHVDENADASSAQQVSQCLVLTSCICLEYVVEIRHSGALEPLSCSA
jgi:hypothetical protein